MTEKISKTDSILQRLKDEKKVVDLNKPEDFNAIIEMNKEMEMVRREFQVKDRNSQISAFGVVLS
jgi:hypothetical protein